MIRLACARLPALRSLKARLRAGLAALMLLGAALSPALAQSGDALDLVAQFLGTIGEPTQSPQPAAAAAAASAPAAEKPATVNIAPLPLPPDPGAIRPADRLRLAARRPLRHGAVRLYNPDYVIATGDRLLVRMWGAFDFEAPQVVNVHGNIFIPNVGPVAVRGVRNADLNREVAAQIKRVFRSNVGVYATLEERAAVKYVTGFVEAPGLYAGLSSDSILYYLDRAGGIDPARGSYLEVEVLRGGRTIAAINLYRFLLEGKIEPMQLQEGDTVVAQPRRRTVQIGGEVHNPYIFEFKKPAVSGAELLAVARPKPSATFMSIVRQIGPDHSAEYHPLANAGQVADRGRRRGHADGRQPRHHPRARRGRPARPAGARAALRRARLEDALARIKPAPQANIEAVQLFRRSIAAWQKELIEIALRSLKTYALTARSATSEEAALRQRESALMLTLPSSAPRRCNPRARSCCCRPRRPARPSSRTATSLNLPNRSNTVLVSGEVVFQSALVWEPGTTAMSYIARAGSFTQLANEDRVVVLHQDGSVADSPDAPVLAGDEVMVLPKITSKSMRITRAITTILFQLAYTAKILFNGL